MKRVIAFLDMFDEVPTNAKYLFSKREETLSPVTGSSNEVLAVLYMHFYEVDNMDFGELVEAGFFKKNDSEKMKEFAHKYKLPTK